MENRNALIVDAELATADGYAERATAVEMLARLPEIARRRTVVGRKGYDTRRLCRRRPQAGVHSARRLEHSQQRSAIDGRATRHPDHAVSMRIRKRIEEPFGWIKTVGGGRKLRYRGRQRNRAWFRISTASTTSSASPPSTPNTPDQHQRDRRTPPAKPEPITPRSGHRHGPRPADHPRHRLIRSFSAPCEGRRPAIPGSLRKGASVWWAGAPYASRPTTRNLRPVAATGLMRTKRCFGAACHGNSGSSSASKYSCIWATDAGPESRVRSSR